ncbi:MAG: phosphoribosyl-ATP diphosphatase [Planctomycetales bacterium]|nr:phosphoribosyl-ATP diphosphatase [Planctomycetales bacterium]
MSNPSQVFEQLMAVVVDRRDNPPERSYTTKLLQGGVPKIGAKILEEAAEVVEAAQEPAGPDQRAHFVYEVGDLLYHLFVLLGQQRVDLEEVSSELARRFGTSGLDEKAARKAAEKDE